MPSHFPIFGIAHSLSAWKYPDDHNGLPYIITEICCGYWLALWGCTWSGVDDRAWPV